MQSLMMCMLSSSNNTPLPTHSTACMLHSYSIKTWAALLNVAELHEKGLLGPDFKARASKVQAGAELGGCIRGKFACVCAHTALSHGFGWLDIDAVVHSCSPSHSVHGILSGSLLLREHQCTSLSRTCARTQARTHRWVPLPAN